VRLRDDDVRRAYEEVRGEFPKVVFREEGF